MYVWNKCCKKRRGDGSRPAGCPIGYYLKGGNVNTVGPNGETNPRDGRFDNNKDMKGQENYGNASFSEQCQALMVALPIGDISKGMIPNVKESKETINSKSLDQNGTGIGGPCAITEDTNLENYMESECVTIGKDGKVKINSHQQRMDYKANPIAAQINLKDNKKKNCLVYSAHNKHT